MGKRPDTFQGFVFGLVSGALGAAVVGLCVIYLLNMTHVVAISIISLPDIHRFLGWAYDNLRLSAIPFSLTLVLYFFSLAKLRRLLRDEDIPGEKIGQAEHLLDIWINLFFGIGVIWTAIGMRSALLEGLGGLDAVTAAEEGAFSILQRLVDGGIVLALSTTIFGGAGGYIMRVIKAVTVGVRLQAYYERRESIRADEVNGVLKEIERHAARLAGQCKEGVE